MNTDTMRLAVNMICITEDVITGDHHTGYVAAYSRSELGVTVVGVEYRGEGKATVAEAFTDPAVGAFLQRLMAMMADAKEAHDALPEVQAIRASDAHQARARKESARAARYRAEHPVSPEQIEWEETRRIERERLLALAS